MIRQTPLPQFKFVEIRVGHPFQHDGIAVTKNDKSGRTPPSLAASEQCRPTQARCAGSLASCRPPINSGTRQLSFSKYHQFSAIHSVRGDTAQRAQCNVIYRICYSTAQAGIGGALGMLISIAGPANRKPDGGLCPGSRGRCRGGRRLDGLRLPAVHKPCRLRRRPFSPP